MIRPETDVLDAAIEAYNRYRRPMATAEIVGVAPDAFTVRFEGPFCRMCCDYDYFEDLQYELARFDVDADSFAIASIEYVGDETFVVEFSVES